MSSISSRPRVQSVSSTLLVEAATTGAVLAGGLVTLILASLTIAAREVYRAYSQRKTQSSGNLKALSSLRQEAMLTEQNLAASLRKQGLNPVEAIQVSTLLTLEQVPFALQSPAGLQQDFESLSRALNPEEAEKHKRDLYRALEEEHQKTFTNALATACANAARKVGFDSIQTISVSAESTRVIATNPAGRALVTEISNSRDHEPSFETEVVGVTDGSCGPILDAFDKALEEEGVRSAPPARKFTGGVCELAAARDFVRKQISPRLCHKTEHREPDQKSAQRRQQRLISQQRQNRRA